MNATLSLHISSACYADFCPRGHICSFCFLVPNKCILMIMITSIGGKEMRFPICHWSIYVYASKPFEFAASCQGRSLPTSLFKVSIGIHICRVAACCVEVRWIPTTPSIRDDRLGLIFLGCYCCRLATAERSNTFYSKGFLELPANQPRDNSKKNRSETPSTTSTTSKENYTKRQQTARSAQFFRL